MSHLSHFRTDAGDVDHSAIAQTAAFLQGLAPRAAHTAVKQLRPRSRVSRLLKISPFEFDQEYDGDELFDNQKPWKAMHQYLCQTHNFDNRPPKTFDGQNKLKVVIGTHFTVEHLLPSGARSDAGTTKLHWGRTSASTN